MLGGKEASSRPPPPAGAHLQPPPAPPHPLQFPFYKILAGKLRPFHVPQTQTAGAPGCKSTRPWTSGWSTSLGKNVPGGIHGVCSKQSRKVKKPRGGGGGGVDRHRAEPSLPGWGPAREAPPFYGGARVMTPRPLWSSLGVPPTLSSVRS